MTCMHAWKMGLDIQRRKFTFINICSHSLVPYVLLLISLSIRIQNGEIWTGTIFGCLNVHFLFLIDSYFLTAADLYCIRNTPLHMYHTDLINTQCLWLQFISVKWILCTWFTNSVQNLLGSYKVMELVINIIWSFINLDYLVSGYNNIIEEFHLSYVLCSKQNFRHICWWKYEMGCKY